MSDSDLKQEFIESEFTVLAWAASVQRAYLYCERTELEAESLRDFRGEVLSYLDRKILPRYNDGCDEAAHVDQIEQLVAHGSKVGDGLLGEAGYKFAVAQKLLNLQLKYLWCLERIPEPPHCPIDRIVISKTALRGKFNWTDMKDRQDYLRAIAAVGAKAKAERITIAQWELKHYERR